MILAVVPVKHLSEAKSRLSRVLPDTERADLVLRLLRHTLDVLRQSAVVDRIMVVTPDSNLARQEGVDVLPDTGTLNASLSAAARWAADSGAETMLIVPADLPFLMPRDIQLVVNSRPHGRGIVLAATDDRGTAALLLSPPDAIHLAFGPDSAAQHMQIASDRGIAVRKVMSQTLRFDLDTEEDLERYLASIRG